MFQLKIIALLALVSVSINVLAEKPDGAGGNKHKPHGKHEKSSQKQAREVETYSSPQSKPGYQSYFNQQHRAAIQAFYANEMRSGGCPPGLAKKQNGCLPPGQAKRWALGQALPGDVRYYDLPDAVMRQIGYPPSGYRFVRVDADVLMLSIATGLVVDAMSNLLGSQ